MIKPVHNSMSPRSIPFGNLLQLFFSGAASQYGWFFVLSGIPVFWIFVMHADTTFLMSKQLVEASGTVITVEDTKSRVNSGIIFKVDYQYEVGNHTYLGTSFYSSDELPRVYAGDKLPVLYSDNEPGTSVIDGMRNNLFTSIYLLGVLYPMIGFIILFARFKKGWKYFLLCRYGILAKADVVDFKETGTKIGGSPLLDVNLKYSQSYEASAKDCYFTTQAMEEVIAPLHSFDMLYLKGKSYRAEIIDNMFCSMRVDGEQVHFEKLTANATLKLLSGPFIFVIGNTIAFLLYR